MREGNIERLCEISVLQNEVLLDKQNTQAKVSNELVNTTEAESLTLQTEPAFQFSAQLAVVVRLTRGLGINHKFQDVYYSLLGCGKPQLTYRFEVQDLVWCLKREEKKDRAKLEDKNNARSSR